MHWLYKAAERAGLLDPSRVLESAPADTREAWLLLGRRAGVDVSALAEPIAAALRLPVADFSLAESGALARLPEKLARKHHVFPLRETPRALVVATSDPNDVNAEREIAFASGKRITFALATPKAIGDALDAAFAPDRAIESILRLAEATEAAEAADLVHVLEHQRVEDDPQSAVEDAYAAPVVRLSHLILRDAVEQNASDVHIEPQSDGGVVRFRVDGVMRQYMKLPFVAFVRVVSRIKVLAKLDIADRLRPQDGRARIQAGGHTRDLRISTIPTRETEKVVIRLLDGGSVRKISDVGLSPRELGRLREIMLAREGLLIVTGPTGSGKTTLLYAILRELASAAVNVVTVEDPVEYEIEGITQIQAEPKRGVTFATALRAILRQDPDVIFVGEIRDAETARIAIQAATTGHFVLATLHTNEAAGAIARLADLEVDMASLAGALRGIIAQRLVRRLCSNCATGVGEALTAEETELAGRHGATPTRRAVGCTTCADSGYRGRVPVIELATMTPAFSDAVAAEATPMVLRQTAIEGGMRVLHESALDLVREGVTTLQEVERVIGGPVRREASERMSTMMRAPELPPEHEATPPALPSIALKGPEAPIATAPAVAAPDAEAVAPPKPARRKSGTFAAPVQATPPAAPTAPVTTPPPVSRPSFAMPIPAAAALPPVEPGTTSRRVAVIHTGSKLDGELFASVGMAYDVKMFTGLENAAAHMATHANSYGAIMIAVDPVSAIQATSFVRAVRRTSGVPIIMVAQDSGLRASTRTRALRAGADEFVSVGGSAQELLSRLEASRARGHRPVNPDVRKERQLLQPRDASGLPLPLPSTEIARAVKHHIESADHPFFALVWVTIPADRRTAWGVLSRQFRITDGDLIAQDDRSGGWVLYLHDISRRYASELLDRVFAIDPRVRPSEIVMEHFPADAERIRAWLAERLPAAAGVA